MAIRVENTNSINFGTAGAQFTASHVRLQHGSDAATQTVRALAAPITVAQNQAIEIVARALDMLFPNGDFDNDFMEAILDPIGTVRVDLMTDANTVVAVSGYSQQTVSAWTYTQE